MLKFLLFLFLSVSVCLGQTWTFHIPANLSCAFTSDWTMGADPVNGDGQWEILTYDQPQLLDSNSVPYIGSLGWYSLHIFPGWISDGWQLATNSIAPDAGFSYFPDAWMDGGYPDYFGGGYVAVSAATEYWVDFDSTGTPRASTAQPADFGKYLWDGSINPSWVEPLAETKHGKALGHTK